MSAVGTESHRLTQYIDQVLPSLGETATLATASELGIGERAALVDPPAVAEVKGDARMVDVIARGVANLPRLLDKAAVITYEGTKIAISPRASKRIVELSRKRFRGRHNARRGDVSGFVLTFLWNQWRGAKADWLEGLIERIGQLHAAGLSENEIRRRVLGERGLAHWFSAGDYSPVNLVKAVLREE